MIDFLLKTGFQMYKHCDCEGGKRWFKKQAMPGVEIILRKRGEQYEIKRSNKIINRGYQHQLETEYNKLFHETS